MTHQLDFARLRHLLDELYSELMATPGAENSGLSRDTLARRILHYAQCGETDPLQIKALAMRGFAGPYLKWTRVNPVELSQFVQSLEASEAADRTESTSIDAREADLILSPKRSQS